MTINAHPETIICLGLKLIFLFILLSNHLRKFSIEICMLLRKLKVDLENGLAYIKKPVPVQYLYSVEL